MPRTAGIDAYGTDAAPAVVAFALTGGLWKPPSPATGPQPCTRPRAATATATATATPISAGSPFVTGPPAARSPPWPVADQRL
ncbi:hypothetical protein M2163_001710 [Streptomyces sp. SAI-135]|uniref:hypothetical protein n=1 Tax=unclassified Streptomyces TaxID=2593676 RepID=UPI00247589D9|nr:MULTISPECIES: hypothetical protein [unclassified Streptomyces]MDH6521302.1 hypothetical protein [Streptomyces sp. SAI-090]MDH6614602.1 hypothetical protein [Streptomyces sp. SAI-135]